MKLHLSKVAVIAALSLAIASDTLADTNWGMETLKSAAIYYSGDPEPGDFAGPRKHAYIKRAAEDLQEYMKKMTGTEVPLITVRNAKEVPMERFAFVLGGAAAKRGVVPPATMFSEDGYAIKRDGRHVLLVGEAAPGTAYAVADFLHQQGVRWYMPGPFGEEVPRRDHITIPDSIISEAPSFGERLLWYNGGKANRFTPETEPWFDDWRRRNRVGIANRIPANHMWNQVFRLKGPSRNPAQNRQVWFDDHPEYFGIVDGKPNIGQLNLGSDAVAALFLDYYRDRLRGEAREVRRIFSIAPDDGLILNENEESKPFLKKADLTFSNLPDATDLVIQFLNRVISPLNKEYPNVKLAFTIYSNYQNGPGEVEVNPNLIPFIAPLNFSRYHALGDDTKPSRAMLASIVERWSKSGVAFGWRDYSFLCPDALMPFTRLHMMSRELPWLYERGCRYYNTETVLNWPNLLPEYYLTSRLLWDIGADQKAVLAEFYERFFGSAGGEMEGYITELANAYNSLPFSAGNKEFVDSIFTPERLTKLRRLMDGAMKRLAGDEVKLHRVRLMETALNQAERFMKMRRAINVFDYAEGQRLNEEIRTAFLEDKAFDPHTNTEFIRDVWYERFYGAPIAKVAEWMQGAVAIVRFDDEWDAHLDLTATGELERLFHPGSAAFDFIKLKTFSRSLAEQGWEKFRGDVWYRQRFAMPDTPEGKSLYLAFGGVATEMKVWIDGKLVGEGRSRDGGPVLIPIAEEIPEGEHTLTVKVSNRAISELGVGGLTRPVALIVR